MTKPERFLDRDLMDRRDEDGRNGNRMLLRSRIQGIDRVDVVREYIETEIDLGRGPDGGPRKKVIKWLNRRKALLDEIGERPDRLEHGPRLPPSMVDSTSVMDPIDHPTVDTSNAVRQAATDGGQDDAR